MAKGARNLHVALFPWLAFGHMMPFLELAKLLSLRGHRVSFISTPRNLRRLRKPPLVTFVELPLPAVEGLPESAESTLDIPLNDTPLLKAAYDGLRDPIARFLESESPDWVVHDFTCYWISPFAADLGISTAFFSIFSAWFLVFMGPVKPVAEDSVRRTAVEDFTSPPDWVPFPSNLAFRPYQAKQLFGTGLKNESGVSDGFRYTKTVRECDAYCIRTCTELEPEWLRIISEITGKRVIPVGLMPPSAEEHRGGNDPRGGHAWRAISGWLDGRERGSVVYIALGSEAAPSQDQLTEMALGLEMSELPFFWVLRRPAGADPAVLPDGFEERTRGRGRVWTSWAPQIGILSHDSVGGFLTHCGWSSVIEGLQRGLPLIMLPFIWDQGLNARVLEEMNVGVEIPRDEQNGWLTRDSVADSLRRVMISDEGRTYKEKAKQWGAMVGDWGLHDRYVDEFVEYLQNQREDK